jgi:hypothetical protein
MLLTLLALALSTAALAQQVRYNTGVPANSGVAEPTGNFITGDVFSVDVTCPSCTSVPLGQIGPVEIGLTGATLDCPSDSFCSFTDGTATVTGRSGNEIFMDTVNPDIGGSIVIGLQSVAITADLTPNAFATAGGTETFGFSRTGFGANGVVILDTVIPEPGTFVMLGTGLIGLAGMARRKLRLGA